jgi:hypothetical protein
MMVTGSHWQLQFGAPPQAIMLGVRQVAEQQSALTVHGDPGPTHPVKSAPARCAACMASTAGAT